jgi:hypothetical protein
MAFALHKGLLPAIGEIVGDIPKGSLHCAPTHGMERLEWISKHNGDYFLKAKHWRI